MNRYYLSLIMGLCCLSPLVTADERPNIIVIMADDLGYGDIGRYGQSKIKTPNLDKLADEGMRFTQHYAGSTVCGPSRASLLTGRHTGRSPIRGNPKWTTSGKPVEISSKQVTLGQVMQQSGYQTALIGKWGMADGQELNLDAMPNQNGFDFFYGYKTHMGAHHYYWHQMYRNNDIEMLAGNGYLTNTGVYTHDLFTQEANNYIKHREKKKPFFMMLSYTIPHKAITVPEDSKEAYKGLGWPQRRLKTDGHYKNDSEGNVSYAGMVSRLDRDIGQLLRQLKQEGILDNTLLLFTSDNGHEYDDGFFDSNGPLRGKKRDLYEGGIRIPLIAYWPKVIKPKQTTHHVSAFWDYLPTFCEIAKVQSCPKSDGLSFVPTLTGVGQQTQHSHLYWEFNEAKGPLQALRYGQYKLLKQHNKPMELYDLEKDIGERNNLIAEDKLPTFEVQKIAQKMLSIMGAERTPHPEFQLKRLPNPWAKKDKN